MAVKLIDLHLIYGVAGARDKFADLVSHLVEGEWPGATQVRVKQGDGGIDIRVGDLSAQNGIDVFQCKFFWQGLDDSQKDQIRKSFKSCRGGAEFKTKKWTLCLPVDLSLDETSWFEDWRAKQSSSGIEITDVWGATKLEGLLNQERNKGVKEAFFKEEHLTQIREVHGAVTQHLPEIADRLKRELAEREQRREASDVARQEQYLAEFTKTTKEDFQTLLSEASFSGRRPDAWEIAISPSWIPARLRRSSLAECLSVVKACHIQWQGWFHPDVFHGERQTGRDWAGMKWTSEREVEVWRLSQSGVFCFLFPIWDDIQPTLPGPQQWPLSFPKGAAPKLFLNIDVAISTLTLIFRFAARLAQTAYDPGDGTVNVSIKLNGTRERMLVRSKTQFVRECCCASEPFLANVWPCPRTDLLRAPDEFAVKAAIWFFERFNSSDANLASLSRLQENVMAGG